MMEPIEEIKGLVTELREQHERALQGVVYHADFEEFKSRIGPDIETLLGRVNDIETRLTRPAAQSADAEPGYSETKAFEAFLRRGVDGMAPEERKALATDDDSTGGYITSPTIRQTIVRNMAELSPIRGYAARETISGNALVMPTESGTWGAGWVGERESRSATATPTLGEIRIALMEMYAKPAATQTQLDDSYFNVEEWIARRVAERFAQLEGAAFVSGTDVTQPEGILTNATVLGAYVASGVADEITSDGMRRLEYALKEAYTRDAAFFCRRATVLALMLLKDGDGRYMWKPSMETGVPSTFDGYPVVECADVPAVQAGAYAVIFGNLRAGYQIVDKATVSMLRDPYSSKPYVEFYTTSRVGGRVILPEAIKVLKISAS